MTKDPYKYFRVEGRELAEGLGKGVLELERGLEVEVVARLLRLAHTLKGAARVVKVREIGDLAHALEGELTPHRDGQTPLPTGRVRTLLTIVDAIDLALDSLGPPPEASAPAEKPSEAPRPQAPRVGASSAGSGVAGVAPPPASPLAPAVVVAPPAALPSPPSPSSTEAPRTALSRTPSPSAARAGDAPSSPAAADPSAEPSFRAEAEASRAFPASVSATLFPRQRAGEASVRLLRADAAEMDALLEGIMEVSVHLGGVKRAAEPLERARQLVARLGGQRVRGATASALAGRRQETLLAELEEVIGRAHRLLASELEDTARELRQVRSSAERIRLLPVSAIFDVLERTARDAAESLGKQVRFEAVGGDMRLEGQVLASLQGALVQVVRNAVVHGLESPEERLAAGKTNPGKVTLEISRDGTNVILLCHDDGRGIDIEAVRSAARKQGLSEREASALGREQLLARLLRGGISTAREVSELAGRGVGVDLVRDAVAQWGGRVAVESRPLRGTSFRLEVPASLSAWEVLLVGVSEQIVAIPLARVRRTVRLDEHQLLRVGDRLSLLLEEEAIPFASLGRLLPRLPVAQSAAKGAPPLSSTRTPFAVVIANGEQETAWGVDSLLGAEQVVIRSLPPLLHADRVVAGASLDAAGDPILVLDADTLVSYALASRAPDAAPVRATPRILVIDDSLTTRMLEQSILETAGFHVDLATSAEEGLEKLRVQRFDLVLVDVEMPGMDGFGFVSTLRADPEHRGLPAILVTSRNSPEDKKRGEDVGASGYVVKSEFDQAELLTRIRHLVAPREGAS